MQMIFFQKIGTNWGLIYLRHSCSNLIRECNILEWRDEIFQGSTSILKFWLNLLSNMRLKHGKKILASIDDNDISTKDDARCDT